MDKTSIIISILIFTFTLQVSTGSTKTEPVVEASHKPANVNPTVDAAVTTHANETTEASHTETKNSTTVASTTAVPAHSKPHETPKKKGRSSAISTATHFSPIVVFLLGFTGIISSTIITNGVF